MCASIDRFRKLGRRGNPDYRAACSVDHASQSGRDQQLRPHQLCSRTGRWPRAAHGWVSALKAAR